MNRREVLTGMALASAVVAIPAAAMVTTRPDRRAWDRAFAALLAAQKASDDFDAQIDAVSATYVAQCAAIPHASFASDDESQFRRTLTTVSPADVIEARRFLRGVKHIEAESGLRPYAEICRKIIAADDARSAEIEAIDQCLGYSRDHERYDKLSSAICDAEAALLKMPAPDGEALLWKVNRLYPEGQNLWEAGYEAQTHADFRRFLSVGRA